MEDSTRWTLVAAGTVVLVAIGLTATARALSTDEDNAATDAALRLYARRHHLNRVEKVAADVFPSCAVVDIEDVEAKTTVGVVVTKGEDGEWRLAHATDEPGVEAFDTDDFGPGTPESACLAAAR